MRLVLWLLLLTSSLNAQEQFTVYFDFNQEEPTADSRTKLNHWILQNHQAIVTRINGYSDSIDSHTYNKKLAERRIKEILCLLTDQNIEIATPLEQNPIGKDFKQSKIQSENRKVTFDYLTKEPPKSEDNLEVSIPEYIAIKSRTIVQGEGIVENDSLSITDKFKLAQEGDKIRLNDINFYHNLARVVEESESKIIELASVMLENPKLIIEIHGHICCNRNTKDYRLSIQRAVFIYRYLLDRNVPKSQLGYKGFGSSKPIYPIPEKNEEERSKNRRVEIKIISK
jgi:outer membrane protein OmpA-like peptidoglycan-associated protein